MGDPYIVGNMEPVVDAVFANPSKFMTVKKLALSSNVSSHQLKKSTFTIDFFHQRIVPFSHYQALLTIFDEKNPTNDGHL